jgi:SAM-dependent methyltransferase
MPDTPWYTTFFGEDYLRVYVPYLTPERTRAEVMGILRLLNLPGGARILDLACGYGRHSIPLAAVGYQVTGLDLSDAQLRRARVTAQDAAVDVRWLQGDMRALPFASEFDAVINIFTAFGYLESTEQDIEVLRQVQKALVPGGAFLLETASRDSLVRHYVPADIGHLADGTLVLQEQQFDLRSGRLAVRLALVAPDGKRQEYRQSIRIYTLTELDALLANAGLQLQACYGDLDGSALDLTSRRLVLLARKPA